MKKIIQEKSRELGFDLCRFTTADPPDHSEQFQQWIVEQRHGEMGYLQRNAHKRVNPNLVLENARSVISLAVSYFNEDQDKDDIAENRSSTTVHSKRGVVARYARHDDYHFVMADRLRLLSNFVDECGGEGTRSLWYVDTGPLLERDLAQRAGIGFIGKHTNVISRELGNWFFLAEIVTTLEIEPDIPERNRCGSCSRCIMACPTNAITAPFELDARRCISYLTIELKGPIPVELRPAIGNRIYGCDDCLAACPWNRFAREGNMMKPHARLDLGSPDLHDLLALDNVEFKKRFAGTPILRTKRRGLLRNVCVALGNTGDASDIPALEKAAMDPEPLISEHAIWAIEQIKSRNAIS